MRGDGDEFVALAQRSLRLLRPAPFLESFQLRVAELLLHVAASHGRGDHVGNCLQEDDVVPRQLRRGAHRQQAVRLGPSVGSMDGDGRRSVGGHLPAAKEPDVFDLEGLADCPQRRFHHFVELSRLQRMKPEVRNRRLLPCALLQLLSHALALGHVARHLGEADQLALRSSHGREHHAGPEATAVLAQAKTLFLEAAGGRCDLELALRPGRLDVVTGIKDGEVASDDFPGRITLQTLGAAVPADNVAAAVEEKDRVVLHAVDHQAEPLFALLELLLHAPAVREIAGDLDIATDLAAGPEDGGQHDVGPEVRPVLAHAPSLVFDAAFGCGNLQQPLRAAGEPILLGVEAIEALSDDLAGRVSLHLPRAGVPGQDATGRIEQENGVVANAVGDCPQLCRVFERLQF